MEDNPEVPELSPDASGEKKCEREFRKLFQEVGCGSSNVIYGKNKLTYHGNVKKKNKVDTVIVPEEKDAISKILYPESKQPTYNLDNLYEDLRRSNKAEQRCQSLIRLAHFCSEEISKEQLTTVINTLGLLSDSHEYDTLAVAHALLLLSLTTKRLTSDQLIDVEESVLDVANSISLRKHAFKSNADVPRLSILKGEDYCTSFKLLQQFAEECQDIDSVDVLTICCTSLKNLSCLPTGYAYKYSPCTVKFVLGMTGKVTQEIVSEILEYSEDYPCVNSPTYAANQCLKILEHMLTVDPDMQFQDLDHEDFSLLHCLTRLLGWSISFPFVPKNDPSAENQDSLSSFHLSTLVSNLKILSVLSFNPETLDSFTNAKGLMEKVMICILKAYFHSTENHFDVLVLALELMINFYLKRKRTFVLLCLKKFRVNSEEIRSIEALLKILSNSLEKIRSFKSKSFQPEDERSNTEAEELKFVLEIADEDMELSTIVAFICILVVFFMETKTSFLEFIHERLSAEVTEEAIVVSNKVLEFAAITGGMPVTGILLLKHAIKKLSQLYQTS